MGLKKNKGEAKTKFRGLISETLPFPTMCIVGLPVDVHIKDGSVYPGSFRAASADTHYGDLPDASSSVSVKRKRGRPRKYPRTDVDQTGSYIPRIHSLSRGNNVHTPPGIVGTNGDQHYQTDHASSSSDSMTSQLVHGVVEATFDAGYLLAVRVGNSATTLRGVIFKPGQVVPLLGANAVEPGVPMIRRNEVPVPVGNYGQNAYPVPSAGKQTYNAGGCSAPSGSQRGTVVPVVLQPITATNGIAASTQFSNQIGASKCKEVLHFVNPQNGATSMHGAASVPMEALLTMPFQTLSTEAMKREQVPLSRWRPTAAQLINCLPRILRTMPMMMIMVVIQIRPSMLHHFKWCSSVFLSPK